MFFFSSWQYWKILRVRDCSNQRSWMSRSQVLDYILIYTHTQKKKKALKLQTLDIIIKRRKLFLFFLWLRIPFWGLKKKKKGREDSLATGIVKDITHTHTHTHTQQQKKKKEEQKRGRQINCSRVCMGICICARLCFFFFPVMHTAMHYTSVCACEKQTNKKRAS